MAKESVTANGKLVIIRLLFVRRGHLSQPCAVSAQKNHDNGQGQKAHREQLFHRGPLTKIEH